MALGIGHTLSGECQAICFKLSAVILYNLLSIAPHNQWNGLVFAIKGKSVNRNSKADEILKNTTILLDTLLSDKRYNKEIRPGFGGPPTTVYTDIEIRSFGYISENQMIYSLDCYFRQTWTDKRLSYKNDSFDVLSMDWKFLQRVWTPDTFFINGKTSYLHKVSAPNMFVRIRSDGQMKYSMRLTIIASCPMHLRKYPLDTQACPLEIGSFAHTANEIVYKWKDEKAVVLAADVTSSQYDFLNITVANFTAIGPSGGVGSALKARFILRRRRGYFILQIYAPSAMIVGASWVGFWIIPTDVAGRVAVGAMTVLTLVTMGFGGKGALPRVGYATAMDWFVVMCFTFVFSAMVEFACVNYTERYLTQKQQALLNNSIKKAKTDDGSSTDCITEKEESEKEEETIHLNAIEEVESKYIFIPRWRRKLRTRRRNRNNRLFKDLLLRTPPSAAYKIDTYSRVAFPISFTVLNVLYWTFYLYVIDDEIPTM